MKNIYHEYSLILMKTEEMNEKLRENQGLYFQIYSYLSRYTAINLYTFFSRIFKVFINIDLKQIS